MKVGLKPIPNWAQSLAAHCADLSPPAQHCGAVTAAARVAVGIVRYGEVSQLPPAVVLTDSATVGDHVGADTIQ